MKRLLLALVFAFSATGQVSSGAKLMVIASVLHEDDLAAQAIILGLIGADQWPGRSLCLFYPLRVYHSELQISDPQMQRFEELQQVLQEHPAGAGASRQLARAILEPAQKEKIEAFEKALQLAARAIEAGLLPRVPKGELLCQ
jgi:hypothetical protein